MSNSSSRAGSSQPPSSSRKRPSADLADPLSSSSPRSSLPPRPQPSTAPSSRLAVVLGSQSHRPGFQPHTSQEDDTPGTQRFKALPAIKQPKRKGAPRGELPPPPPPVMARRGSTYSGRASTPAPLLGKPSPALRPALAAELEAGRLAKQALSKPVMGSACAEAEMQEASSVSSLPASEPLPEPVASAVPEPSIESEPLASESVLPLVKAAASDLSTSVQPIASEAVQDEYIPAEPDPTDLIPEDAPAISLPERPAQSPKPAATGPPTPAKGRGRPKGWKPGMSYAKMRGTEPRKTSAPRQARPKPGTMDVRKRRGRPPKQASPTPRDMYHKVEAHFIKFLCEWRGCKAELQNLETLKRHIDYVHLEEQEEEWYCEWGKCGHLEDGRTFPSYEKLESHLRTKHMEPFAWHIGDGPSNESGTKRKLAQKANAVPSWLKDKNGNQVTPSVEGQEIEDHVTWRENRRKLKELLLERDRNLPSESDEEALI